MVSLIKCSKEHNREEHELAANRITNTKPVYAHEYRAINECYDKNTIKTKINLKYKNNKSYLIVISIRLIHFQCNNLIDVLIIM